MAESETDELQDTEITLGTGKLLAIFFGLVVLCSIFFTMGYLLGRSNASGARTDIVGEPSSSSATGKPSAVNKTNDIAPVASAATTQTAPPAPAASPAPASTNASATLVPASNFSNGGADAQNAASGATYMVQVAAVSKREDADLLVSALQKKQYPVFVATVPGDALFHVQVGPFTDPKDAESMRSRLVSEGYNPIVKK